MARPPRTLRLRRPRDELVRRIVGDQRGAPLTYSDIGATAGRAPAGWAVDEAWVELGRGDEVFERACDAVRRWVPFDLPWVEPLRRDVPIAAGELFAFTSRQVGIWAVNVCRVVYVVDEPDRFGFAYGTVGAHAVRGEERFLVERLPDGRVRFGISKFSKPALWLLRLLGPLTRHVQSRFTQDALQRMVREVA